MTGCPAVLAMNLFDLSCLTFVCFTQSGNGVGCVCVCVCVYECVCVRGKGGHVLIARRRGRRSEGVTGSKGGGQVVSLRPYVHFVLHLSFSISLSLSISITLSLSVSLHSPPSLP